VLENYFADGAYRFQMQFGRGSFAEFYGPTALREDILRERKLWLESASERYLVFVPEAESLVNETVEMAVESGTTEITPVSAKRESGADEHPSPCPPPFEGRGDTRQAARWLGENWEPDYLLLTREAARVRLVCACVCFPSSWAVEEKIGRPIEEIHEIVPALNPSIGRQIHTFLERLKPGVLWTRSNWGLSRSAERNQHPHRGLARLDERAGVDEVFFRVEEQSLMALPRTNGILFGIRIKVFPLRDFIGTRAALKLKLALETMPEPMAQYKGITSARNRVIQLLGL
jgi:hypothetical protein